VENGTISTVKLESGVVLAMRQLTLADENFMAEAKKQRRGNALTRAMQEVLERCTAEVVDPGPYQFLDAHGKADWHRMCAGDRIKAMLELRKLSYTDGEVYTVENVTCPCSYVWDHDFNIDEDLTYQPLSEESAELLREGKPFEVKIDNRLVQFRLQSGETEELFDKLKRQKPGRKMAAGLRSRIVGVEGLEARDIMDWLDGNNGQSEKYPGLSSDDAEQLRDAFDAADCGVDTEVEAECPDCGRFVRFDLPFDGILLPGKKIRERKRARRGMVSSGR